MPDPKGLALIIGGGKGKPPPGGESMGEEDTAPDAKVEAIRRFREALEGGDDEAAAMAFKDAYHACMEDTEEADEEPMPDMPDGEEEYS
jgi:hypothetical protein